jgi:hypothetical protein
MIQGKPSGECRIDVERSASGQDRSCNAYSKGRGIQEGTQGDPFLHRRGTALNVNIVQTQRGHRGEQHTSVELRER